MLDELSLTTVTPGDGQTPGMLGDGQIVPGDKCEVEAVSLRTHETHSLHSAFKVQHGMRSIYSLRADFGVQRHRYITPSGRRLGLWFEQQQKKGTFTTLIPELKCDCA